MSRGVERFEFGPFQLEPAERRLVEGARPVALTPKAFELLVILVENAGRLLKKDELIERLWPGTFVEEVNLAQNISALRRALGGESRGAYIQTVAGSGYRFVATVRQPSASMPAGPAFRERLLVLPFRMLKPDPEMDFLAFSLPDALTSALSAIDSLIVRSTLVAARFAGDTPDLRRIAREAQVDYVVSGTVLRAGGDVRVTAQLSDAAAGTLLWSHAVQTPVDDLFQLQDLLTDRICNSLSQPLTMPEQRRLRHDVPATPRAYELYLRANHASPFVFTLERTIAARDLYLQSLEEDPSYAPTWARLARMYRLLGKFGGDDAAANMQRADDALQRALRLNPDLMAAHNLYAQIEVDRGHAAEAMTRLVDQLRHRGPHAELYAALVQACRFCGLLDAAIAAHRLAIRHDPATLTGVMHAYFVMRRWHDVLANSGQQRAYVYALSLHALGRSDEALAVFTELEARDRLHDFLLAARELIAGRAAASIDAMKRALGTLADPESYYYAARHLAYLGDRHAALEALERSVNGGYTCVEPLTNDPWLDALRHESRFEHTVARAHERHAEAVRAFEQAGGARLLELQS